MFVMLGRTGAPAVRVRQSLVLDPDLPYVVAFAAVRAAFPRATASDIQRTLEGLY